MRYSQSSQFYIEKDYSQNIPQFSDSAFCRKANHCPSVLRCSFYTQSCYWDIASYQNQLQTCCNIFLEIVNFLSSNIWSFLCSIVNKIWVCKIWKSLFSVFIHIFTGLGFLFFFFLIEFVLYFYIDNFCISVDVYLSVSQSKK